MRSAHSGTRPAIAAMAVMAAALTGPATALNANEALFAALVGSWSGKANVQLANGSETLTCKAYYTTKDDAGLGLAIRCASPSNKIELRAALTSTAGKVTGTWEERTYNAVGTVVGQAQGDKMNLAITGGAFKGTMAVTAQGKFQSVTIRTEGTGLQSVTISLQRG